MNKFNKLMTNLENNAKGLSKGAHQVFVENTPKNTGNARQRTKLQGDTIIADYDYSKKLDDGFSKKNPQGMTAPTEKWIEQEFNRRNKGL